jgi:Caspase domain
MGFLLDWASGTQNTAFVGRSMGSYATAIAPDRSVAAQGDGRINDIILWNPEDGKALPNGRLRAAVRGADGLYNSIRWRPDGKAVAWRNLSDGRYAEFDFTTLTLKRAGDLKGWDRNIVRQSGPLKLEYKKHPHLDVTGGANDVSFPVWPNGPVRWDFTFLDKDRVLASTWDRPSLQVFDAATGKKLSARAVVQAYIQSIAVAPDRRSVLVGSTDQTLTIYDPADDKLLLTLFPAGADWIVWTPDGYYAATPGGERRMGWQIDNGPNQLASFFPADRFRKQLYRPDVIKLVLEKGSVAAALRAADAALQKNTKQVALDELLPPRVTLEVVAQALPRVKVRASATARGKGQPIKAMRLMLDGKGIADQPSIEFADGKEKHSEEWEITLPGARAQGNYKLTVLARSEDSSSMSNAVEIPYLDKTKLPALHVLAIGIDGYQDPLLTLKAARHDATALCDTYTKQATASGIFRAVKGTTLLDAKRDAVKKALADMRRQEIKHNDLVVVFFAGHGIRGKDGYYLLTQEANTTNDQTLAATTLTGSELRKTLGAFPCQVLLMLDACHAGAFGGAKGYRPATDDLTRELANDDVGVVVLCAAMASERAQERGGEGLFTKAVVAALQGADGVPFNRSNRLLYVHHLYSFVVDEVSRLSDDEQHPFWSPPSTVPSFPVTRLKR